MREMIRTIAAASRDLRVAEQWLQIVTAITKAAAEGQWTITVRDGLYYENRLRLKAIKGLRVDPIPFSDPTGPIDIDFMDLTLEKNEEEE